MAEETFAGELVSDSIEVRFPISGKVKHIYKKVGESVTAGQLLAELDRTTLEKELASELAMYDKVRASFDLFTRKYPTDTDDTVKFLRTIEQAELTRSVKAVEVAKAKLDSVVLSSPVNGYIVSDSSIRPNIAITPASHFFTILDLASRRFEIEVPRTKLKEFAVPRDARVEIDGITVAAKTTVAIPRGKSFYLQLYLQSMENFVVGLTGKATIMW